MMGNLSNITLPAALLQVLLVDIYEKLFIVVPTITIYNR